jgi:hypothetical protein
MGGATVDLERSLTGSTPLYAASWAGALRTVQFLVANGAKREHVRCCGSWTEVSSADQPNGRMGCVY